MTRAALGRHPAGVFFALAAALAVALPWVWLLPVDDPRLAHVRLGIFGFGGAAVAGYILTAQKAWTGRDAPLPAPVLGALALAARAAALVWPEAILPVALPLLAVAAAVLWPVVAAGRWARLPLGSVPLALVVAEVALTRGVLPAAALPLAMAALILAVGGRAVPAFLAADAELAGKTAPRAGPHWPGLVLIAAAMALAGPARAAMLALAALWVLTRLGGFGHAGPANRMLALAYGGLAPALVAFAAADAGLVRPAAAEHLVTMGVMGPMILAFASRTTMRRPAGQSLRPLGRHRIAFAALAAAAVIRAGAEAAADPAPWITLAGMIWSGGWLAFLAAHLPALARPAPFPVLSAARKPPV
ncbi:NnrS family protein [Albidovulum sp.]|uniref:NnrS family protein n=1 Tax=Albidovulum sp. TaxID=1872424 RepID=UPI0039B9C590